MDTDGLCSHLNRLNDLLEVSHTACDAVIGTTSHLAHLGTASVNMRFNYIRLDGDGRPKVAALVRCLIQHLVNFAISSRRRPASAEPREHVQLFLEARDLLARRAESGEAGELLLYMLTEALLGAPQMVAKFELKTSPAVEVHGADGIHMKWNEHENLLDVYFGESKLVASPSESIARTLASIETFHKKGQDEHELRLVTSHFKWADTELRNAVAAWLNPLHPVGDYRTNHACLIGYSSDAYRSDVIDSETAKEDFLLQYRDQIPRLSQLLTKHAEHQAVRMEVFFLPFPDVKAFREAFCAAL